MAPARIHRRPLGDGPGTGRLRVQVAPACADLADLAEHAGQALLALVTGERAALVHVSGLGDLLSPPGCDRVERWLAALQAPAFPAPGPSSRILEVHAVTGLDLLEGAPRAGGFPGGYRRLQTWLVPDGVWARWRYLAEGRSEGVAHDALGLVGGQWCWLPSPWRAVLGGAGLG